MYICQGYLAMKMSMNTTTNILNFNVNSFIICSIVIVFSIDEFMFHRKQTCHLFYFCGFIIKVLYICISLIFLVCYLNVNTI